MLYTVMPPELVWAEEGPSPNLQEVRVGGRLIQLAIGSGGERRVVRLYSTDPRDYLDPRWQPGEPW